MHRVPIPVGIKDGQKLEKPIFTPSTKAEQGAHASDENISPEQGKIDLLSIRVLSLIQPFFFSVAKIVGQNLYDKISSASLNLYEEAVKTPLILANPKVNSRVW